MTAEVAGSSRNFGYQDERQQAVPPGHGGMTQPSAPQAGGRQLVADQPWDTGGLVKAVGGRVAHFVSGAISSRPGAGAISGMGGMGGEAAEGGEAAGIGEIAADVAPLALAA